MNRYVILTATYNHPNQLASLYKSLTAQNNKDFSWIIVDDGSKNDTHNLIDEFVNSGEIDIVPIHQDNGGKSSAINNGLNHLDNCAVFVVIVDDDEVLNSNAIDIVDEYYTKYSNSNCGVIHFNRLNEKGAVIANPIIDNDFIMSYQSFKSNKRSADGYIGYFINKLGDNRFTLYKDEKYIGPSTLFMKVTENSDLLWAKATLGKTEYLAGGITKQGRKLRIKNPKGMIEYCRLMQKNGANFKTRLAYSIQGFAYYYFVDRSQRNFLDLSGLYNLRIFGKILNILWKRKFT